MSDDELKATAIDDCCLDTERAYARAALAARRERDEAQAQLRRLREIKIHGCDCSVDDACAFARERDEAREAHRLLAQRVERAEREQDEVRAEVERLREAARPFTACLRQPPVPVDAGLWRCLECEGCRLARLIGGDNEQG